MTQETANIFFDELKEWSERKLNLLSNYLDSAARILSRFGQVYYVDGFAGKGIYGKDGEPQIPGSPLRAIHLAQRCLDESRAYSLQCINIESDPANFQELCRLTAPYSHLVQNFEGTFVDNIDQIIKIVRDKPVVCFLDPFGVDGIDWSAITKLIRRQAVTDLWIRFDSGEVRRRDGWYGKPDPGADKQFDILCRVYGIYDRSQLHIILDGPTSSDRKTKAINLYLDLLTQEFRKARNEGYAYAYRVGSLEGEEKYHLIGATAGKKGAILASNIVYGVEESYQREVERYKTLNGDGQLHMFAVLDPTEQEVFDAKAKAIEKDIWNSSQGKKLSRLDIHVQLLSTRFGIIKGPHITQALKNLQKAGYIVHADGQFSNDATVFTFRKP